MMLPYAQVKHHLARRTRIEINEKKGDRKFLGKLARDCSRHPQVQRVFVHPVTGSLILHHQLLLEELKELAEDEGWFTTTPPPAKPQKSKKPHKQIGQGIAGLLHRMNNAVREASDDQFDLLSVAAVGLVGLAVLQHKRGKWLPAGLTLLFQATSLAAKSARVEPNPTDPN